MAQPKSYRLSKPPAYHYDLLLLSLITLACGLLGLPPINGVLPQAPMHTAALAKLKQQMQSPAAQQPTADAAVCDGVVTQPQSCSTENQDCPSAVLAAVSTAVSTASDCDPWVKQNSIVCDAAAGGQSCDVASGGEGLNPAAHNHSCHSCHTVCGVEDPDPDPGKESLVVEQRLSGLMQAVGVLIALGATPAVQQIPTGGGWVGMVSLTSGMPAQVSNSLGSNTHFSQQDVCLHDSRNCSEAVERQRFCRSNACLSSS